jgi:hypothetical protein
MKKVIGIILLFLFVCLLGYLSVQTFVIPESCTFSVLNRNKPKITELFDFCNFSWLFGPSSSLKAIEDADDNPEADRVTEDLIESPGDATQDGPVEVDAPASAEIVEAPNE